MRAVQVIVAAALLLCGAAHADLGDHRRASRLLSEWRLDEARERIGKLVAGGDGRVDTTYLRAELAFLDGDYAGSLRLLETLPDRDGRGSAGALEALVTSTAEATRGFVSRPSPRGHFVIWYQPGKDEVIVDLAGEALDRAYEVIGDDLGVRPKTPIRVELLTRPSALAQVSTLTEKDIRTTNTIALCKYNKLMAVTPRATLFGYAWLDTLVHEYVHYAVSSATRDRVPVWLHEGLARFQQTRWRDPDVGRLSGTDEFLLASAVKSGEFISFDAMHPSMAKLPTQEAAALAYAEVYTMVRYVHGKSGYPGLRQLLSRVRDGADARDAITEVAGARDFDALERAWKDHLRHSKLTLEPALAGRAKHGSIRFDDGGKDSENLGISELDNAKATKHARLGGMLRARGLFAAAAIEYEKALAITGRKNPLVAGKLARTYLALKEYQRAIELAQPLLAADDNDAAPATTLGIAYQATGNPDKAAVAFEAAVRVNPFDPAVRCGLAAVYAELGQAAREKRERDACRRLAQ